MGSSGVKSDALSAYGTNSANAQSAYKTVSPLYQQFASGTDGYTPEQSADLYTAAAQSSGGGQSAAEGAQNLETARDGNAGGFGVNIADSARQAGIQNSNAALNIQNQSTQLADQRQMAGAAGLQQLYQGSDAESNANLNTANQAEQPFWKQALLQGIKGAAQGATMGA